MAGPIHTIVFLTFVIFCNCDADSPTPFIIPPEEPVLITNVLTNNLDGQPVLPTLHVFKEEHGKLLEEAVKDILPAEENNNAKPIKDITEAISNERNGDFNQIEIENANKNQDFTVLRTNIPSDITSNENKVNTPTADINTVKEVVDKTETDTPLTVNIGISGELIKEDVVRESEAKPTLVATENVYTDKDNNAAVHQSTSTIHKEESTSKHLRHRTFQPTHKYSRPTNKSSLKHYNRQHVTTTAKPVHFVPSKKNYNTRTYIKHTATTSNNHHSYHSQNSKIKTDSDTSETTESSVEETTQMIQHQITRRYRQNHRFSPKKPSNQHTYSSSFSRGNPKSLEENIAIDNVTSNNEMTHKPESNQEHSNSDRISHYRSPGYHFKPHSNQTTQHTKNVLLSKENIKNNGTTTKAPMTKYHRYTFNKHPLNLNQKLILTTQPTTTAPIELKDIDNKNAADVKPTMATYERFRHHQKTIFNRNTQTAKNHSQEEIKSDLTANQKEKSNDGDDKGVSVVTTPSVYQRFRQNRPRMSLMPKIVAPVKNLENHDDTLDTHGSKTIINTEDNADERTTTSIYQRFRTNRPRMNFSPKIKAEVKNLENHGDNSESHELKSIHIENDSANEHTTSIYHRFGTNRPHMNFKPKIEAQQKNLENHGDKSNNNKSNNTNNKGDDANEGPTTSIYQRFRTNRPHIIIKPKIQEEEVKRQKSNTNNNGDGSLNKPTTSIYQRYRTNRPHMMMRPKTVIQSKNLENDEKVSSNNPETTNNENNSAVEVPTTTSIYQRYRQHSPLMHLKTLPLKSHSENIGEENIKSNDEHDDGSTQVPTPKNVYQRYGKHSPHMHTKTQTSKSTNYGEENVEPYDEDNSSTQIPTLKNIYQRHSPHMHVKTQVFKSQSDNLGEVNMESNDENDSSTQVPTTTNIYQRFRQHRPHMHLKTQSSKLQSGNLGVETNDEDDSSIEVPTPRNIYQRYGKHSPHMHVKTQSSKSQSENFGGENIKSNVEDESATQVPTTTNIYEKFRQPRPHMHLKTPTSKSQSGKLGEVNMESNDEENSSTQIPTLKNIYQRHSPHMHVNTQSSKSQSGNLGEVNVETTDDDDSSIDVPTPRNIYQRYGKHSPHMHVKTQSSKLQSENFGGENIKSYVEDESATQVPTTTNIYERFRQPRPHMHVKPVSNTQANIMQNNERETTLQIDEHQGSIDKIQDVEETDPPIATSLYQRYGKNRPAIHMRPKLQTPRHENPEIVQYNENQDDFDLKSSDDVHGISEIDDIESREDQSQSSIMQSRNTYRRNQRYHRMNPKYLSNDDDEEVNDFNTHSSRKANHNPSYRRRRPYDMRYRPSVQNDDSEEVDIEPENSRRINRFQRRFANPANLENSDLEQRSLSIDDFDGNLHLLKRRSRENSSYNKSLMSEGLSEVPKVVTRSDQNTPEQTESINLFSAVEDHDESLFETYDPGEEYSFFDIQDDISPTDTPVDKVTVTLPKSFIAEDKTNNTARTALKFNDSTAETEVDNIETTGLANPEEMDHMQEYINKRTGLSLHETEPVTVDPNHWFEVDTDEKTEENKKEIEKTKKNKEDLGNKPEIITVNPNHWFDVDTDEKTEENENGKEEIEKHEEEEHSNVKTNTRNFNLSTATEKSKETELINEKNSNSTVIKQEKKDKENIDLEVEIKNKYNKNVTDNINKNHPKIEESFRETNISNTNNINTKEIESVGKDKSRNTTKENISKDVIKDSQYDKITKTVQVSNITSSTNTKMPIHNNVTNTNKENITISKHLDKDNKTEKSVLSNEKMSQKSNTSNEMNVNKKVTEAYKKPESENSTIENSNKNILKEFQHDNITDIAPLVYVSHVIKENVTAINHFGKDNETEKSVLSNEKISQKSNTSNENNVIQTVLEDYKKNKSENSTVDNSNKNKLIESQHKNIKETVPIGNVSHIVKDTQFDKITITVPAANITSSSNTKIPINNEVTNLNKENTTMSNNNDEDNTTEKTVLNNENIFQVSNTSNEKNVNKKVAEDYKKPKNENSTTNNSNKEKLSEFQNDNIKETIPVRNVSGDINKDEKNIINTTTDSDLHKSNETKDVMTINKEFSEESNEPKENDIQNKETENVKKYNNEYTTTIENSDEQKLKKQTTKIYSVANGTNTSNEKYVEKNKINTTTDNGLHKGNSTEEVVTNSEDFSENSNEPMGNNTQSKETENVKMTNTSSVSNGTDTSNEKHDVKINKTEEAMTDSKDFSEEYKKPKYNINNIDIEDVKKYQIENTTIKFDKLKEIAPSENSSDTTKKEMVNYIENITSNYTPTTNSSMNDNNKKIESNLSNEKLELNSTGIIPSNHKEMKQNKTEINKNKIIGDKSTATTNDDNKEAKTDKIKSNTNEESPKQNTTMKVPKIDNSKNSEKTEPKDDMLSLNTENIALTNENSTRDSSSITKNVSTNNTIENVQNVNNNMFSSENITVSFKEDNITTTDTDTIEDLDEEDDSKSNELKNIVLESNPTENTSKSEEHNSVESHIFKIPPRSTAKPETEIEDNHMVNTNTSVLNKDKGSIANNISTDNNTDNNYEINEETTQNVDNLFIDIFDTDDDGIIEIDKSDTTTQKMSEEVKEDVSKPTETNNESEESMENNSMESNIFKIPPRSTPKAEIEIKENEIVDSSWPVISGNILGKKTKVNVKLKIKNDTLYIPSDVAIYEDLNNLNLYFNWSLSNETKYRMSLNLTKTKSKYYEIEGVEVYRWKGIISTAPDGAVRKQRMVSCFELFSPPPMEL
ncbi:unnamed protein product [Psylliodes chrysocephalus]|uniref:Uncharacterized protein n=1 Tax=Psylliodes chrysocephalus TaxID=3402493 RepID=A0A9P0CIW3_9CUCU|nr:unnamed protein product [Psylliodes chrysocephala]